MKKDKIYRRTRLMKAGLSEAAIGRMLGVSRQSVHKVMDGRIISKRIADALCRLTNTPFSKFFPETAAPKVTNKEASSNAG